MTFRVGQKVVCIDPTWGSSGPHQKRRCPNLPTKGGVYTIRALTTFAEAHGDELFLLLNEVVNVPAPGYPEPWFFASKYRPIVEKKTDISIFTDLLNPTPQKRKLKSPVTEDA